MQDGKIAISARDITTNPPYVAAAHLWFDHHLSESVRNTGMRANPILHPDAPSAARVVWNYHGGARTFPPAWNEMMAAVDQADAARFTRDEVLFPQGWNLLNFLMDARTGLGRFHEFRISNYQFEMAEDVLGALISRINKDGEGVIEHLRSNSPLHPRPSPRRRPGSKFVRVSAAHANLGTGLRRCDGLWPN